MKTFDRQTFIETYYPDYCHAQEIADNDDLQCIIDGEDSDGEKLGRMGYDQEDLYNNEVHMHFYDSENEILEKATEEYYKVSVTTDHAKEIARVAIWLSANDNKNSYMEGMDKCVDLATQFVELFPETIGAWGNDYYQWEELIYEFVRIVNYSGNLNAYEEKEFKRSTKDADIFGEFIDLYPERMKPLMSSIQQYELRDDPSSEDTIKIFNKLLGLFGLQLGVDWEITYIEPYIEEAPGTTDSKEDEIWGLMIHNRHSTTFAVYESEERAREELFEYVKGSWGEHKEEPTEFKPAHIDQYFAEHDTEGYQLEKMVMNGANCLEH